MRLRINVRVRVRVDVKVGIQVLFWDRLGLAFGYGLG